MNVFKEAANAGWIMMHMNDTPGSRRLLVTFDLLLLVAGIALLFVASVNGLGVFLCAAAVGLLILTTRPKWFKFYLLAWLVVFVVSLFLVSRHYRNIQIDNNMGGNKASEVAQAIQEQYNTKNEAIAKKDMAAVWKLRTRDYTDVNDGTGRGAAELQTKQAILFERASSLQGTSTVESVTLNGKTAVVRVKESGTIVVPNPQVGQDVVMMNEDIWLETWVLDKGQWLTRQSKVVTNSITINGKPVPTK